MQKRTVNPNDRQARDREETSTTATENEAYAYDECMNES